MSLASTASPWTNDDPTNKKKTPTMNRKTIKTRPANNDKEEDDYMIFNSTEIQQVADERTNRVTEIINQMSAISVDNDGSKLADFTPPPNPAVQQKKPQESNLGVPLQMPPSQDTQSPTFSAQSINPYATPSQPLGNYREVYNPTPTIKPFMTNAPNGVNKPFYASMGLGSGDGKLLEKINYMIHMLENLESEKTANITEEFVLYSFTGIFIIFILDSFLKTGRYVR
jgi:hypothetical protein